MKPDEPTNEPIFNWGHPSHIEAEWERRDENEGIGFQCRAYDHPLQYKIDIWSQKGQSIYKMRLDGFGHLRWFNTTNLAELIQELMNISIAEVIAASREMSHMTRQAHNDWKDKPEGANWPEPYPEIPESVIAEYFEAARSRTVAEMHPLLHFGDN